VNVSPDNSGTIKVNGSAVTSYPSVFNITLYSTVTLEAMPPFGYTFSNWSGAVTDTTNPTSLYVNCDKTVTATFAAAGPTALYFPHVETSLPWQTEIAIINTGDQSVTGTLKALSDEGQFIETRDVTLSAHGRRQIVVSDFFTNHINIGYLIYETGSDAVQGYTKFYQPGNYRAAIPAVKVKEVNTSDIYIPHIASNAQWWTEVILVNTTSATKELTIAFNTGQSVPFILKAYEHKVFTITSLFNNKPQAGIESAVIANARGIIGMEVFGNTVGGNQMDEIGRAHV
jgi:hypothetical protein